ncbi:lipoprotein [Streptomyces ruber]|uniref:Lipoprotein n=2 Tax=Streptomyces TaxID=1883 RepID=A0A918EUK3_9ACTN|nr:Ig-like domain-containing protein [Streptomyces ruber]GGQ70324.1 lipoprotein [Streptomyces ruber]
MNGRPIAGASVDARKPGDRAAPARGGRRRGVLALLLGVLLLAATACSGDDDKGGDETSRAVVTIAPKNGADGVNTTGALKISAAEGRLTEVRVRDAGGTEVKGRVTGEGAAWTPSGHLKSATEYSVQAVAEDADGRRATARSTFTTLTPKKTFETTFTPEDGSTVGVGMPFSLRFDSAISDPAKVERAITVQTRPAVEVAGHWFGDDRIDFRPERYWKPGTKVTVGLDFDGLEGRPGVYGTQTERVSFTIGRSQISTVDAGTKEMVVERDGKVLRTLPVTTGAPGYETWNGQMVVSERYKVTRMNGATVGYAGEYDIPDVPHAMRLTTSGTFIHGNYWSGAFGYYNASHGCIGLRDVRGGYDSTTAAAWFYDNSMIGDVVIVRNSDDATVAPDNGLNGWNMPWEKWKA